MNKPTSTSDAETSKKAGVKRRRVTKPKVKAEPDGEGESELDALDSVESDDDQTKPSTKGKRKAPTPKAKRPPPTGEWTPEKRAMFMDRVIEAGYKSLDLGALAEELGLNRQQLANQLAHGRKGSFRDKAVKFFEANGK